MTGQRKPSWRDFHNIHEAAEFYHQFSTPDQLKELTEDIDERQVIFDSIHTASVLGKTFVIDGVTRLDAAEKTGRQIVDEKGNWIGVLAGRIIHHCGKTDQEVWEIARSLNEKRRHLTADQWRELHKKLVPQVEKQLNKAEKEREQLFANANNSQKRKPDAGKSRRTTRQKAVKKVANMTGKSPATVYRNIAKKPNRKKKEKSGFETFEAAAWHYYGQWLKSRTLESWLNKNWRGKTYKDFENAVADTIKGGAA